MTTRLDLSSTDPFDGAAVAQVEMAVVPFEERFGPVGLLWSPRPRPFRQEVMS